MKYSMPILVAIAVAAAMQWPHPAEGQSKDDIFKLQRYIFDVEKAMKELREQQNERLTAIEATQQKQLQAVEALSAQLKSLQQETQRALTEQQKRVAEPVEVLRNSVDGVTESVSFLQGAQRDIATRTASIEQKLDEVFNYLKTMNVSVQPDAPPGPLPGSIQDIQSNLFTSAVRDYNAGRDDLAMQQFRELVEMHPTAQDAPQAYIYIGYLYDRAGQFNDAVTAYERVLANYPDSTWISEAMYSKGESLRKANKKQDSITAFRAFLDKFPNDPKKGTAEEKIREQGGRP